MTSLQSIVRVFTLLLLMVLLATPSIAIAQDSTLLSKRIQAVITPLVERVAEIEQELNRNSNDVGEPLDEDALTELKKELDTITAEALQRAAQFQPGIADLNGQIRRLPPPPAEGQADDTEEIAARRKELSDERAAVMVALKDAELVSVRAASLTTTVLERRRSVFLSTLLQRRQLDASVFNEVVSEGPAFASRIFGVVSGWASRVFVYNLPRFLIALVLATGIGLLIFWMLRPLRRSIKRVEAEEYTTSFQRLTTAFFSTVVPAAAFAIFAFAVHQMMNSMGLYGLQVDRMAASVLTVISGLVFVGLLLWAVLSPHHPQRRLIAMNSRAARRLFWLGMAMAVVYGLDHFAGRMISLFSAPVSFSIANSFLTTMLMALLLVFIVLTRIHDVSADGKKTGYRGWHPVIYWLLWLGIIAIVMVEVAGYVQLSRFIAGQMVITGSIVATMYTGYLAARAVGEAGAVKNTLVGSRLQETRGFTDLRLDQLGLAVSILINILVFAIGLPALALQWGIQADEVEAAFGALVRGFSIGGVNFSFGKILLALIIFSALLLATRAFQRWFDGKVLARTRLDSGLQNSIRAGLGYIGFIIATMVGLSWAGINLSNLALIAGALSVGIGFGLQNIVNNFVSGVIMLVERPIKVGDIINVSGVDGFVRKINVRATEIEPFDRQSVIIPNSEVINTAVGNWMHIDHVRRIIIPVGVAYGSDIEKVRQLLLDSVKGDSRVATNPEPFVYFADFGASSLDFQLRFFIRDLMETVLVESDVRFRITALFAEHDIEIPFPQQVLHVKNDTDVPVSLEDVVKAG